MKFKIQKNTIFLLALVMLLFTSCKTYEYFNIEVLEPAELYLSPAIQTLALAHNISLADDDSTGMPFRIYGELYYDTVFIDTALARASINGLADELIFTGRLATATIDSLEKPLPKNTMDYTQADIDFVRNLCDENASNAFLVLNQIAHENSYDEYFGNSGGFYGVFEVVMNTEWLLINPYTSKLLDKKNLSDTLYFELADLEIDENDDGFEIRKEILTKAALTSGYDYASWISPHYVQTSRLIFTKGDKNIKLGYEQAQSGNWKNAAYFWRESFTSGDSKIKAKASFNLALANEMEGLLEPALEWAKESYTIFPDELNATYISILEKRIRQQKDILKQMGDEDVGQ
jgi:hypothetical protein